MSNLSILVVDDDVDIATNISDILGHRIDTAYDGASAMELVNGNPYDVALLDFKMPDMDGATLYEQIKKQQPELVAIMVTAFAGNDGVERARDAGVWQVMSKPVDIRQLIQRVDEAAGQPLVLVVDHDSEFCNDLWDALHSNGYRVGIAGNANDAREQLEKNQYQIVLLESSLGGQSSEVLLQSMRDLDNCPATVIVTDHQHEGDDLVKAMLQQGAQSVCYKPVEMAKLLAVINQLSNVGS